MSAGSLPRRLRLTDSYGFTLGGIVLVIVTGLAVFVAALVLTILFASRAYGRTACHNFASQTGFETKFVLLNWADTGTCLARAPDGKWVLNTKVVQFVNGGAS